MRFHLALIIVVACIRCFGAEGDFYRSFRSIAETNESDQFLVTSLMDKTNTAPKLEHAIINLEDSFATGTVADIRFGMTMDEVVNIGASRRDSGAGVGGGPRFFFGGDKFGDTSLMFSKNALSQIVLPKTIRFNHNLSARSAEKEWIKVLGLPTKRTADEYRIRLIYEKPGAILHLTFPVDDADVYHPTLYRNLNQTNDSR